MNTLKLELRADSLGLGGSIHFAVGRCMQMLLLIVLFQATSNGQTVPTTAQSPATTSKEYKVKVAYLYNFSRYFEWPEHAFDSPSAPFVIGVLGNDPLSPILDRLAKKKHGNKRPIVIRRFSSWDEYQPCHILFIPRSTDDRWHEEIVPRTKSSPLLVVSEASANRAPGTIVSFYPDANGTIGFEIDVDAAKQRELGVDAKLLKIARVIRSNNS